MNNVVCDTSVVVGYLLNEEKCVRAFDRLVVLAKKNKIKLYMSIMTELEVRYVTLRRRGEKETETIINSLKQLPVEFLSIDQEIIIIAAKIKAKGKISLADSIIAATACNVKAQLLTKDPEFLQMKDEVEVQLL